MLEPDGRACGLCGSKDTDQDPIGNVSFLWGKPIRNGKNQGTYCYYCFKTYHARFRIAFPTVEFLKVDVGKNNNTKTTFFHFRGHAVRQMKEAGKAEIRINWAIADQEEKQRLLHHKETIQAVQHEDAGMKYSDYFLVHGDPITNGKGHRRQQLNGVDTVVMPGPKVFKILHTDQFRVDLEQVVDDGSNQVGDNQLADNFRALSNAITMPQATGVSIDELFGRPAQNPSFAPPAATAAGGPAATGASVAPASASSSSYGWGFNSVPVAAAAPVVVAADPKDATSPQEKPKRGKSSSGKAEKSTAKEAGSSEKKGRGRPKRDISSIATKFLEDFAACTPDASYFVGKEQHAQKKWMDTLTTDISKMVDEVSTDSERTKYTELSKQLNVICDLTRLSLQRIVGVKEPCLPLFWAAILSRNS
jgi:hypothetical protein